MWKGSEVMAEYINKAEALHIYGQLRKEAMLEEDIRGMEAFNIAMSVLEELSTIGIVHCKECKHRRGGNCFKEEPKGFNYKKDTDYCSKGERRTE